MIGTFDNIRIIDQTATTSSPLADMGNQGRKSDGRAFHPFRRLPAGDISVPYFNNSRSQKPVALYLEAPAGREALPKLAATDVFVQNFGLGVIETPRRPYVWPVFTNVFVDRRRTF